MTNQNLLDYGEDAATTPPCGAIDGIGLGNVTRHRIPGGGSAADFDCRKARRELVSNGSVNHGLFGFGRNGRQLKHGSAENSPEPDIKDPFVLEFLGLKDEYSESELEDALIRELEQFLLELGNDFAFIARQKRLRVGTEWYRVDLLFFHRRLRSLIVVELKLGKFTHADAGQMNLYLNYAREHWTNPDENPPIGLILCSEHDAAVAHYSLGNLGNQVLAREYQLALPTEEQLAKRLEARRRQLDH